MNSPADQELFIVHPALAAFVHREAVADYGLYKRFDNVQMFERVMRAHRLAVPHPGQILKQIIQSVHRIAQWSLPDSSNV